MFIKIINGTFLLLLLLSQTVHASGEHGSALFHAFNVDLATGEARDGSVDQWDFDGWIGGDDHKLALKSEGEVAGNSTESSESWALYSRNIATFWDAQAGARYDNKPESVSSLVFGFSGLAPYYFETEAHLFVSDEGDVSARFREENDFLITQKLILKPYGEINLFAQDVPELNVGSGLSNGELGLQLRYEVTRKFAPYFDIRYEKLFGDTASIANTKGEQDSDFIATIGLQLMF